MYYIHSEANNNKNNKNNNKLIIILLSVIIIILIIQQLHDIEALCNEVSSQLDYQLLQVLMSVVFEML